MSMDGTEMGAWIERSPASSPADGGAHDTSPAPPKEARGLDGSATPRRVDGQQGDGGQVP